MLRPTVVWGAHGITKTARTVAISHDTVVVHELRVLAGQPKN